MSPHVEARRRYVTGLRDGRADFVLDENLPMQKASELPGHGRVVVWGADESVGVPNDGTRPSTDSYFPAPPGWRFVIADIPAGFGVAAAGPAQSGSSGEAALDALGALHTTTTVDVVVVTAGELVVRLDGGVERTLRAGDSLVQNGLPHAWINRSEQSATIAIVVVGADAVDPS